MKVSCTDATNSTCVEWATCPLGGHVVLDLGPYHDVREDFKTANFTNVENVTWEVNS